MSDVATATPVAPAVPEAGKAPEVKEGAVPQTPEVKIDPLEKEVSEKWGEDWKTASPKIKERALEAERKVREADKRFQQVAKIQKDYDLSQAQLSKLVEMLKTNPRAILENKALGLDIRKLAEDIVWEQIQREKMDPKDREIAELKAREAERAKAEEEAKSAREKEESARKVEELKSKYKGMIDGAIAEEKLPKTPKVFSQMAYYMKLYRSAGKEVDMKAIAGQVRKDFMDWNTQFLDSMPEDQLLTATPKSVIEKLRKADLAALRAAGLAPKPGPKPGTPKPEVPKPKETAEEWRERMRRERGVV